MAALLPPSRSALDALPGADAAIVHATQSWLETAVIGMNLCPFAKAVHRKKQIRYMVSHASDQAMLTHDLTAELTLLAAANPHEIETTLLIHPQVLQDFFEYNDFLKIADRIIGRLDLDGVIQIASFHPDYVFAHCASDAPENCTNRSPYPMLHLLREESIESALAAMPDSDEIYLRNITTLQTLGMDGWNQLWRNSGKE